MLTHGLGGHCKAAINVCFPSLIAVRVAERLVAVETNWLQPELAAEAAVAAFD